MPISQLPERCWVLRPDPALHDGDAHYGTEAEALRDAKEMDAIGTPELLPDRCWIVGCDGACEIQLDTEDEGYLYHHTTRAEAEQTVAQYGWILTRDGEAFCQDDAPDCSTADLAVIEQIPGQLTLGEGKPDGT